MRGRWAHVRDDDPDEGGETYVFLGVLNRDLDQRIERVEQLMDLHRREIVIDAAVSNARPASRWS